MILPGKAVSICTLKVYVERGMARVFVCSILLLVLFSVSDGGVVIDPSDANIQYMGRWKFSNPSLPKVGWQGASITVNFEGTEIKATLDSDDSGGQSETFRVVIDDDHLTTYTFSAGPSPTTRTLATGLTYGVHKLVLMKETYRGNDSVFHGFEVTGAGLVAPPPRPALKLECFGDSNAAGHNAGSEDDSFGTGQYFTFPFIAARALGAEMHNQSTSGEVISGGHSRYDRWDYYNETPHWDFGLYTPDAVIVNLGANNNYSNITQTKNQYNAFLNSLRSTYPDAHICLMNGFGWAFSEPADYTDEVIAARGDSNMSYLHFPWVFERWHGCEYDHAGMARYLIEHLETVLGITAANAQDVMDGYGRNGNVANGSFEEVAPFGGWGWRYFDDAGVSRVYDPGGAHDGNYYLRLSNGAHSQQTNPANSGETITVTAWMRGASNGDQVEMTIDFRDQGMGGRVVVPTVAFSETKTLTTSWQEYSITATAPTSGNPVYASRASFTTGGGDTVDIDDVVQIRYAFGIENLRYMVQNWLSDDSAADIAPVPLGDGIVSLPDFGILSQYWQGSGL